MAISHMTLQMPIRLKVLPNLFRPVLKGLALLAQPAIAVSLIVELASQIDALNMNLTSYWALRARSSTMGLTR
jgi:hypothetical protein